MQGLGAALCQVECPNRCNMDTCVTLYYELDALCLLWGLIREMAIWFCVTSKRPKLH